MLVNFSAVAADESGFVYIDRRYDSEQSFCYTSRFRCRIADASRRIDACTSFRSLPPSAYETVLDNLHPSPSGSLVDIVSLHSSLSTFSACTYVYCIHRYVYEPRACQWRSLFHRAGSARPR